eukprot:9147732-Karenia_brevis.AAC.1
MHLPVQVRAVADGTLVEYGLGDHMPLLAPAGRRQMQRQRAEEMAAKDVSVSSQMRKEVAKGSNVSELSTPERVYRQRSNTRVEARADGGSSPSELELVL